LKTAAKGRVISTHPERDMIFTQGDNADSGSTQPLENATLCPTEDKGARDYQMTSKLNGVRVLIVEDSWDVAMAFKRLLAAWGADTVGPVATTHDAMRLVAERAPDVALVDINLRRGEKAYDLIERLHQQGIRIVVMSGYADVSLTEGKAAAILQKPVQGELLLASLRAAPC
jgi:CheY-like chemotaxis protein